MKKFIFTFSVLSLFAINAFAANGDLTVNGNVTVTGQIYASQGTEIYKMIDPSGGCTTTSNYYIDSACTVPAPGVGALMTNNQLYGTIIISPYCRACASGNPVPIGRLVAP